MVNPASSVKSMTNQQLRAYFRETRDEEAFREILNRGLDEKDKTAARTFKAWKENEAKNLLQDGGQ